MAKVIRRVEPDGTVESVDSMLRRFKKQVTNQGIIFDYRKHEFFVNNNTRRKEKSKQARIRELKNKR